MKVTLKEEKVLLEEIKVGDGLILTNGELRIVVRLVGGYGTYVPENSIVYYNGHITIEGMIKYLNEISNTRVVKIIKGEELELMQR